MKEDTIKIKIKWDEDEEISSIEIKRDSSVATTFLAGVALMERAIKEAQIQSNGQQSVTEYITSMINFTKTEMRKHA